MTTYKDAGVDIDVANEGLSRIKKHVNKTFNKYTLSDIGSFGGCFNFPREKYKNPVLVSSVDGVGTKLLIASLANRHDTIGQCLVNHCVNDILVIGARPLFFLDYFAAGKLNNDILEIVNKYEIGELENFSKFNGFVSGINFSVHKKRKNPKILKVNIEPLQPIVSAIIPPEIRATLGNITITAVMKDNFCAASSLWKQSLTITLAIDKHAAAPRPWITRIKIKNSIYGEIIASKPPIE